MTQYLRITGRDGTELGLMHINPNALDSNFHEYIEVGTYGIKIEEIDEQEFSDTKKKYET
jgi:hypothetical protein